VSQALYRFGDVIETYPHVKTCETNRSAHRAVLVIARINENSKVVKFSHNFVGA